MLTLPLFRNLGLNSLVFFTSYYAVYAKDASNWDPLKTLRVGYVLFSGFEPLDIFGPLEILYSLSGIYPVTLSMISFSQGPVNAAPPPLYDAIGPQAVATHSFTDAPDLDVLIMPGGRGLNWLEAQNNTIIQDFVSDRAKTTPYIVSVCTGAATLAQSGVLSGKRATTNKAAWSWVTQPSHGTNITWVPSARWVRDGNIWTSSGVAAGIDMMYAFLSYLYGGTQEGKNALKKVMNIIEYAPHTDEHWDPFSVVHNVPGADTNRSLTDCTAPVGF